MTYDQEIQTFIATIKADKSITQPWRNKAVARLEESQAFVRMGLTTTTRDQNTSPDVNLGTSGGSLGLNGVMGGVRDEGHVVGPRNGQGCICSNGLPPFDPNCLVHGIG